MEIMTIIKSASKDILSVGQKQDTSLSVTGILKE
jgi:hypothetical protein